MTLRFKVNPNRQRSQGPTRSPRLGAKPGGRRIPELDGLRGIALTLVVLFHLFGHGRVSGGVDVFLFVSGLVLAMSLRSALTRGEQGRVWRRWGRTFSRLAAPAAIVLVGIIVMSFTILPPWTRTQTLSEVAATSLYLENWQLIFSQLGYGAAGPLTSPVQHFWSLSVQGQYFIVVPLAVALAYAARRLVQSPALVLWLLASVATAASFVYAWYANGVDPAVAYFDTFTRFWEFGVGVLVGGLILLGVDERLRGGVVLGWIGLAAILVSGFVIDGAVLYPGPAALVPIGGAALIALTARSASQLSVGGLLRTAVLRTLNRYSYALYLWHWPVLIAYLTIRGRTTGEVGWRGAVIVLGLSAALAAGTWWLVERPLMRSLPSMPTLSAVSLATIAMLLVPVVSVSAAVITHLSRPTVEADGCRGAAAMDPGRPECVDAIAEDAPLIPAFESLREDDDNRPECWSRSADDEFNVCSVGDQETYSLRLLAVGDSHNNTLLGAYEEIALAHGWRIDVAGRAGCHWTHAQRKQNTSGLRERCAQWVVAVDQYVSRTPLDAIIVTNSSRASYEVPEDASLEQVRAAGFADAWSERSDRSTPIIAIRDNPIFPRDSLQCVLDSEKVDSGECSLPRGEALREDGLADAVALDPYAHHVDLTDYMCDTESCALVIGGVIVTRDGNHLTAVFARSLAPYLDREITSIVGG